MSDKVVGRIYCTNDYSKFKRLEGNRKCVTRRKNKIKASIESVGWVRNPIIVNKAFEVIDGQGRLEALKELGAPVEYVIDDDAGIEECVELNKGRTDWSPMDYCENYAECGDENYIRFLACLDSHSCVTLQTLHGVIANKVINSGSASTRLKEHNLIFTEARREEIEPSLEILDKYKREIYSIKGQRRKEREMIKCGDYEKLRELVDEQTVAIKELRDKAEHQMWTVMAVMGENTTLKCELENVQSKYDTAASIISIQQDIISNYGNVFKLQEAELTKLRNEVRDNVRDANDNKQTV